ncbi:hypothetical protein [Streptomyces sp. 5-10]|uniref:hypothetical protein n=1 Tax=Streptomyces sp. 5-10 TaxID=878925 RepID=UPI00168A5028|nr:hypothetical protein [Streptomyces sp. 5-10]MBD3003191.1 hypothetical protein [Streptomyces sp. 5-10]
MAAASAALAPAAFKGVRGGFVRVPPGEGAEGAYALDVRGKPYKAVIAEAPLRTRPGDVLPAGLEPTLVYRPATRTVAPRPGCRTTPSASPSANGARPGAWTSP